MNFNLGKKYRPMSEINIVPYVDVMLVLLVIFMVTAPLLTQGVQVDLPQAKSDPLPVNEKPPIVVTVDALGNLFLDQSKDTIKVQDLSIKIQALLKLNPTRSVLIKGDKHVEYGKVMNAMVILKRAGVSKLGLMTQHYGESSS